MTTQAKLRNIGPKGAAWLRQVGLRTHEDLLATGAVEAFMRVKRAGFKPSLNLLYALEGALLDCHWQDVPEQRRTELVTAAEAAIALLPPPRNRPAAHERVTWILALAHGHQRDTVRQPGGQILEGVHREIDPPLQHRVVDLPREEGAAADLRERHVLHHVARGANLDPYRLVPGGVEPRPHVLRLPERERARPRTDAERRAHRPPDPAAAGSAATRAAASSPEAIASPSATPSR